MHISPEEGRVIGSLIEKQLTTPQQYPLTLNALGAACNQSSNRDPVVSYDDRTLHEALAALKGAGLVRFVYPSHGRSVVRYRQVLEEKMAMSAEQLALVGVLLLRGPQTAGELRTRTERMAQLGSIGAVEAELEHLSKVDEPLVSRLPRRPGDREERWAQLLADSPDGAHPGQMPDAADGEVSATRGVADVHPIRQGPARALPEPSGEQPFAVVELSEQVAALRGEVAELRAALEELQAQLGV